VGARVILLDDVPASAGRPAASLRIGPDRRLYLALDDGGEPDRAGDLGSFSGKVLRLNADGTTPDDQAGGTPVFVLDVNRPAGLDWGQDGTRLWVAEQDEDGVDRLDAVMADGTPRRGRIGRRYNLPEGIGVSNLAFYWSAAIPALRGDLLLTADAAKAVLRVRLDAAGEVIGTEWLLRERIGAVRAIGVAPDGAIYLSTPESLWRITPDE
jgi:glucose/arabinose dehydrogenase